MSFLDEICNKKFKLKSTDTIVTNTDGSRFLESKNNYQEQLLPRSYGFVVDTAPDNVPAKIISFLYLGSQDCCDEIVLKTYNISNVLSIGVRPHICYDNVSYKFVECLDLPDSDLRRTLDDCIPYIKTCLENEQNVLVHCNAGVSRSSSVVIGFLMLERRLSFSHAFALVKSARKCIKPNFGFEKQLRSLGDM